jgi:protein-L-isoaspartate(D-aspartate) O-methyltransferase
VNDPERLRTLFVDTLARRGAFRSRRVEAAFRAVPRHRFLPGITSKAAYQDRVIVTKVEHGMPVSASSQPSFMAVMLEQLGLEPGHRVLEIGAGTGYNAALMAEIVGKRGKVISVDIDREIVAGARACLREAGYRDVVVACADGARGHAAGAPYDRIIVTVGAWDIPPALRRQLGADGRLVVPLSIRGPQRSIAFQRVADVLVSLTIVDCDLGTSARGDFAGPVTRVPLGRGGRLWLWFDGSRPVARPAVDRLVSGRFSDMATGRSATVGEIFGGLYLWLALHDPRFVQLGSEAKGGMPWLLGLPGKLRLTAGLLDTSALCVLTPGGTKLRTTLGDERPLPLGVRTFGNGALTKTLIDLVSAWDDAGRPETSALRVAAYTLEDRRRPRPGEFVIDKRWSRLVLTW